MDSTYSYVMTLDGNFYEIEWGTKSTYKALSETEFYKRSGYKKSDLQKLAKSVYPTQGNDYLLLKWEGSFFPVDYKLVPLVDMFWKRTLKTMGWNQPDAYNPGFVSFDHYTKTNESALTCLQQLLKGLSLTILDTRNTVDDFAKTDKKIETLNKKGILVIEINTSFLSLHLNDALLGKVLKHLHLKPNTEKHPGGVIVNEQFFKLNKLQKKKETAKN